MEGYGKATPLKPGDVPPAAPIPHAVRQAQKSLASISVSRGRTEHVDPIRIAGTRIRSDLAAPAETVMIPPKDGEPMTAARIVPVASYGRPKPAPKPARIKKPFVWHTPPGSTVVNGVPRLATVPEILPPPEPPPALNPCSHPALNPCVPPELNPCAQPELNPCAAIAAPAAAADPPEGSIPVLVITKRLEAITRLMRRLEVERDVLNGLLQGAC